MRATLTTLSALSLAMGLSACAEETLSPLPRVSVPASVETAAVAGAGDAADDPAFWRAADPAQSRILGTDKTPCHHVKRRGKCTNFTVLAIFIDGFTSGLPAST